MDQYHLIRQLYLVKVFGDNSITPLTTIIFPHTLCHSVLPYSNGETVTICQSESLLSLKKYLKHTASEWEALPILHRTDHSRTSTHQFTQNGERRVYNTRYLDLLSSLSNILSNFMAAPSRASLAPISPEMARERESMSACSNLFPSGPSKNNLV